MHYSYCYYNDAFFRVFRPIFLNCHHIKRKTTSLSDKYVIEGDDGGIENISSPLLDKVADKNRLIHNKLCNGFRKLQPNSFYQRKGTMANTDRVFSP